MNPDEINRKVAEKLGWKVGRFKLGGVEHFAIKDPKNERFEMFFDDWKKLPHYSTDIKAAWEILGNQDVMLRHDNKKWRCWFNHKKNDIAEDTAPMAIALAFLKLP